MEFMEWDAAFKVGDPRMDAHHRVFFQMVAGLWKACEREDALTVAHRVSFLVAYTQMHFAAEEQLMAACGFPGLDEHRRCHQEFSIRADALARALVEAPESVTMESVLTMMQNWFTNHIVVMDQQFAPWVEKHNQA